MGFFKAYDMRGTFGVDFDLATVYKVGKALPGVVGGRRWLVGRDARASSPAVRDALVAGLRAAGAEVTDLGLATTPMVYFFTAEEGFDGSVMVTASHNPPSDNGLKVSKRGALPVGYESGLAEVEARVAADAYGLLQAQHARTKARQELADILRFWPLAEFEVDGESILSAVAAPGGGAEAGTPLEELVWTALTSRKDLRAADETLALRKAQVIEALAGFLPNVIAGGGGASLTLEDVALRGWAGSLAGVWSVFGGFRTIQQYRAARATHAAEFRLNEDRMLAVVLSVADCWRSLREAQARATVAAKAVEAATLDHAEAARRFDDGRETLSTVLDKVAVRDEAEVNLVRARYAAALAAIMLRQAVGLDIFKSEER